MGPVQGVGCRRRFGSQWNLPQSPATSFRRAAAGLAFTILTAQAASAEPPALTVELNKLEPQGSGCRAYLVVTNDGMVPYQALKLDLVLFQPDGVIGRRFVIDLAPVKASKRAVKLFDLDDIPCDGIGSFLINEAVECKMSTGPVEDCLAGMTVKSLTNVQLNK